MMIALDASSTCWYLARQLPDRPLHVFTNSQPICQELAKRDQITHQQVELASRAITIPSSIQASASRAMSALCA